MNPGELVADFDGIVVLPRAVEDQVLHTAYDKVTSENASRADLLAGKSLRELVNTYGVL